MMWLKFLFVSCWQQCTLLPCRPVASNPGVGGGWRKNNSWESDSASKRRANKKVSLAQKQHSLMSPGFTHHHATARHVDVNPAQLRFCWLRGNLVTVGRISEPYKSPVPEYIKVVFAVYQEFVLFFFFSFPRRGDCFISAEVCVYVHSLSPAPCSCSTA